MDFKRTLINKTTGFIIGICCLAGAGVAITSQPVFAQEQTPVEEVEDTLNSVGAIAATGAGIVVVSLGVRLAIKQVNRVMTKG